MKLKKQLALLLATVLLVGILAACGTSEKEDKSTAGNGDKKVLVMGTSADYPPFEYVETSKSDEIKGFDIDIAKAIGKN